MFSNKLFSRITFLIVPFVFLLFVTGCSSTAPSESQSIENVYDYGAAPSSEPSTVPAVAQAHTAPTIEPSSAEPDSTPELTPTPAPDPDPAPIAEPTVVPSSAEPEPTPELTPAPAPAPDPVPTVEPTAEVHDYVLNTNTKKFHRPDCSSVKTIKDKNRSDVTDTRENIISYGYVPCKKCYP